MRQLILQPFPPSALPEPLPPTVGVMFAGRVTVPVFWQPVFGEGLSGVSVAVTQDPDIENAPTWEGEAGITYPIGAIRKYYSTTYYCEAQYTTQENPAAPNADPFHWRYMDVGFDSSPAITGGDGHWAIEGGYDSRGTFVPSKDFFIFMPASRHVGTGGAMGIDFVAISGGIPPTGVETSYRPGDDGDIRAGGGAMPATGVTTSYRNGDDGDIQAGVKG
jgi:hypothetical protein